MKIALCDMTGHKVGGDVTWIRELKHWAESYDHELIQFRWSLFNRDGGAANARRAGTDWVTARFDEADVVVVPEGHAPGFKFDHDLYLAPLRNTTTPIVTGLHGGWTQLVRQMERSGQDPDAIYDRAVRIFVTSSSFITNDLGLWERWLPKVLILPYIPYTQMLTLAPPHEKPSVVYTGRITATKGVDPLVDATNRLGLSLRLSGAPNHWSVIQKLYQRLGGVDEVKSWETSPWKLRLVEYTGRYSNPWEVLTDEDSVHVNLTSYGLSPGHLEYTTLEAMDAGYTCVVPVHATLPDNRYSSIVPVDLYWDHKHYDPQRLEQALLDALWKPKLPEERQADLALHDAATYFETLLRPWL